MPEEVHVTVEFNMEIKRNFLVIIVCLACIKIDCTCSCLLSHLLVFFNACGYNS